MSPLLYWEDPVQSGAVFIPVFTFLMAVQYNSLISGNLQISTWRNLEIDMLFLVFAYAALLVLTIVGGCKAYVYVMVGLLKKLPDEPSSDPLHMVIFSIL